MHSKRDVFRLIRLRRLAANRRSRQAMSGSSNTTATGFPSAEDVTKPSTTVSIAPSADVKKLFANDVGQVELEDGEDESLAKAVEQETAAFLHKLAGASKHSFWEQQKYAQGLVKLRGLSKKETAATQRAEARKRNAKRSREVSDVPPDAAEVPQPTKALTKARGGIFTEDPDMWED